MLTLLDFCVPQVQQPAVGGVGGCLPSCTPVYPPQVQQPVGGVCLPSCTPVCTPCVPLCTLLTYNSLLWGCVPTLPYPCVPCVYPLCTLFRYNSLLGVIRQSLSDLLKALKGLVVMSQQLEEMANSLFDNHVPAMWASKVTTHAPAPLCITTPTETDYGLGNMKMAKARVHADMNLRLLLYRSFCLGEI